MVRSFPGHWAPGGTLWGGGRGRGPSIPSPTLPVLIPPFSVPSQPASHSLPWLLALESFLPPSHWPPVSTPLPSPPGTSPAETARPRLPGRWSRLPLGSCAFFPSLHLSQRFLAAPPPLCASPAFSYHSLIPHLSGQLAEAALSGSASGGALGSLVSLQVGAAVRGAGLES